MSTIDIAEPIQERFQALREDWKSRTRHLSNVAQIALVSSHQQIIGMGPQALPLILAELQQETDNWFWALEAITGENPVPKEDAGDMAASAAAWIAWGKANGHLQ